MRTNKFILAALICAGLALSNSLHAQIGYLDGPSPIEYATNLNPATFTVSSGASVLVVIYGSRTQGDSPGSDPGTPTNMKWNGNAMTRGLTQGSTASTWDDNSIYYLFNPPPGTGSLSATVPTSENQIWWMAYTLTGVDTNVAVITGSVGSGSASTVNNTVSNLIAGDWAVIASSGSGTPNNALTIAITPTNNPTVLVTSSTVNGSADMTFGSVSNLPAGNDNFKATTTGSSTTLKMILAEAVFTAFHPAPPAPTLVASAPTPPAQVDLSWTEPANSFQASFILKRGRTSGGPYTDFTNVLSATATNFVDANVVSGTTYFYVLGAANANGTNYSSEQSATPTGPPFAPLLGAGASGAGKITLHWTSTFGTTNYIVKRSTTSGAETQIATTTTNVYTDSGLTSGTTYYYEVVAAGVGGSSAPSDEASAVALAGQWYLFDNFSLDVPGAVLNGQTGSAGLGKGWTNLGGGTPILVANSPTFGGANYAQYAPNSPTSIGDYEAGLGIASNSTAATVFLEFSLPGIQPPSGVINSNITGTNAVAMNFDIDNSLPPGALTGQSSNGPSAQFNYDNTTGFGFFRVLGGNTFYYATISPSNTPYLPTPGDVYYFWFVINAAKGTYQIYLANGSMTSSNVDSGGLGAAPTLMWGTTATNGTGSVITYGFRNVTAGGPIGQPVSVIGTGPGSTLGSVAQNEFANIYVDQDSQDLTNPVTGAAPNGTPQIFSQPQPVEVFAGETATFTILGSAGVNYQWESNGVPMVDGGNVSGSATSTLTISNVTAADAANYSCVVNNSSAFASSLPASLTIVTPNGAFETAQVAAGPSHFYAFNDTGDTFAGTEVAYDFAGADNGIYGNNSLNGFYGILGPNPSNGFPGFSVTNYAVQIAGNNQPNNVAIDSPWNLNTNSVTITAWVNPSTSTEPSGTAIAINRGTGTDVEGLIYNGSGNFTLGYDWNNDPNTTNWNSGLLPPSGQWSFVTLVVTPTNAIISMMNTNGILSAEHVYPHPVEPFAGTTMIGDDPGSAIGALNFNGDIDEVGIFNQALSQDQLETMFADASGLSGFPATNIVAMDTPTPVYPGETVQFSSVYGGSDPLTFDWQIDGTNLTDGASPIGYIIGSATPNLIISNLAPVTAGNTYFITLVTSNAFGPAFTNNPAVNLSVSVPNSATTITTTEQEAAGADWNTGSSWSDGNPVSVSIYASPGSTYEILPGNLERTPIATNAVFPGNVLVIEGNGVLFDGNSTNFPGQTTTGELRLKESGAVTANNFGTAYTNGGSVTFPDLQLNGGQVDNGSSSEVAIDGEIDVLTNSTIYSDSAATTSIRSFQINALLTGAGTLTYSFLGTASAYTINDLIISNPSNTFSGQWNVTQGALVGNAPNSLGTNSITVGTSGALETTYNLDNPNANLTLNGQMYLYTADTFYSLTISGSNMPPGTYTWAQLNANFPLNFPVTWTVQLGSTTGTNTGSGSITVLASLPPTFTLQPVSQTAYPGENVQFPTTVLYATNYQWWFTNDSDVAIKLTDGGGIFGSQTTTLTVSNISSANEGTYALVATGPGGSTTSSGAQLTVSAAGPPTTITTTEIEAQGTDWNTAASWNDNLGASVSEFANPGSTYEILANTLERSPVVTNSTFPGNVLIIDGDGNLVDGNGGSFATTGELRLKESGTTTATNFGTVYTQGGSITFPDLQLNGGQVDNGNSSAVVINGEIDVLTNSSIYADSEAAGSIRSMQINALLTGSGTLTFTYLSSNSVNNDLIISGSHNTFTGQWNIGQGGLLGNAPNSLGTNSITIGTNGILETTYNLNAPAANLTLFGQMYLYTADTFNSMSINGTAISPGTYTFAQLNSAYPASFPVTWPVQLGSSTGTNTGAGSIHVLTGPAQSALPATISSIALSGGNITLTGAGGANNGTYHVVTATNVAPPINWTVVTNGSYSGTGTFSVTFPVTPGDQQQFFAIRSP